MADIDIQEKKRSVWPWILGVLGLVLLVWVGAELLDDDDADFAATDPAAEQTTPAAPPPETDAQPVLPEAVTQFEEQCGSRGMTTDEMSLDHSYEEECVREMTAALEAVIERETVEDTELSQMMQDYRARTEQLTENRESPEHSEHLRVVFGGVAQLIAHIEDSRENAGATLDRRSDDVEQAAEAFTGDEPVLEQRDEVAAFFRETAAALRTMATTDGRS